MDKKKKGLLPRIEFIIIIVFFLSFIVWAISKCSSSKPGIPESQTLIDSTNVADSLRNAALNPKPLPNSEAANAANEIKSGTNLQSEFTRLYITIDGLKLRSGPSLDSTVTYQFKLFEEVYFMNEVTDSTTQLSLGKEVADEPWVKVRSKRGKEGWVYGAGVHYHKKKREGVQ